jgi:hypothetical protein
MAIRTLIAGAVSLTVTAAPATGITITQNTDVAAGMAAFGPSTPLFTWANLFPSGASWPAKGSFGPGTEPSTAVGATTAIDPVTGATVTALSGSALYIANWIDGTGFDLDGGASGPDLAFDGPENFTLSFPTSSTKIGLAMSTGVGGAQFQLTTNTGDAGLLTLSAGLPLWLFVESLVPFTSITFYEPSGVSEDQYFGNIVAAPAPVPLPPSIILQLTGLGLLGLLAWRQRKPQSSS